MAPDLTANECTYQLRDSGDVEAFVTGAVRDNATGKGRTDLLPMRALIEVSRVFEAGGAKRGDRNWEKGIPLHRYADSGMRHFFKWMIGRNDEPHLAMACWNLLCLLDTVLRIKEGMLPESLNTLPSCPELEKSGSDCPPVVDEGKPVDISELLWRNEW